MSLTGPVFLDGIVVLTILAFAGVIVVWPWLTGRTFWHVSGRVGALALVNVLVLLTAATQLNANYLFFASWSDLSGAISGHIAQTGLDRGGQANKAPGLLAPGPAAKVAAHVPSITVPPGSDGLLKYTVQGRLSGLKGTVLVQLPANYTSPSTSSQRYPVLEAMHGYPSAPIAWEKVFKIREAIAHQVQAHAMRPALVVMPTLEIPGGVDTEGVDGGPGHAAVETWLTRDVPDWVAQHFRVQQKRDAWATIGYSAGGFVAAMATILHPAQYGAGIVLGGYFRPEFGPFYEPFLPASPLGRRYDLPAVVSHRPPPVSLWVETSHADVISYASSARFLRRTSPPMAVHAVLLRNAGHRDSVWIALLPEALRWLGTNVHGFHP